MGAVTCACFDIRRLMTGSMDRTLRCGISVLLCIALVPNMSNVLNVLVDDKLGIKVLSLQGG